MQLICLVRKLLIMTSKLGAYGYYWLYLNPHSNLAAYVKKTSSPTDGQCRVSVRTLELGLG